MLPKSNTKQPKSVFIFIHLFCKKHIQHYLSLCVLCVHFISWSTSGSGGQESASNAGDLGSIPGLGRIPREGNGNPPVFLPGESPWTEEPGGLQSMGS